MQDSNHFFLLLFSAYHHDQNIVTINSKFSDRIEEDDKAIGIVTKIRSLKSRKAGIRSFEVSTCVSTLDPPHSLPNKAIQDHIQPKLISIRKEKWV